MDSSLLFTITTLAYLASMVLYIGALAFKNDGAGKAATGVTIAGAAIQTLALALRWIESYQMGIGRVPLSNLYESLVFFTWCTVLLYLIIEFRYKTRVFGAFVMPVAFLALAFINVTGMSTDITPLVPALKSNWLFYHVLLSFISYAAFGIAFAISMLYLLLDTEDRGASSHLFGALGVLGVLVVMGYIMSASGLKVNYWLGFGVLVLAWFSFLVMRGAKSKPQIYLFLTICGSLVIGLLVFMGIDYLIFTLRHQALPPGEGFRQHMFEATFLSTSVPVAAISWIAVGGLVVLLWTKGMRFKEFLKKFMPSQEILDDLTYKMIAIGWPLFTAGGLVMGAIWANSAWGTYWSWDPKETWSLITWFVYSIYLHARYVRGWKGTQMAVISSVGFLAVMFTYLGVNLVLSGLHSYGGIQ